MDGQIDRWMDRFIDLWMDRLIDLWMDRQIDRLLFLLDLQTLNEDVHINLYMSPNKCTNDLVLSKGYKQLQRICLNLLDYRTE